MRNIIVMAIITAVFFLFPTSANTGERTISEEELKDKISAFWFGQLVGNYYGLPFENNYVDEPVPFLVDKIYTHKDDSKFNINRKNWRDTRKMIHDKYFRYKKGSYEAPVSVVSSLNNGLCGIMEILCGQGDFMKTVGIAVSAEYDCDNQAATCAGLIGVLQGTQCLPLELVEEFKDQYVCWTRDEVPITIPISNIVERIADKAKEAIIANGGRIILLPGDGPSIKGKTLTTDWGETLTWKFGNDGLVTISDSESEKIPYVQEGNLIKFRFSKG